MPVMIMEFGEPVVEVATWHSEMMADEAHMPRRQGLMKEAMVAKALAMQ
jgi:hypothetical protein